MTLIKLYIWLRYWLTDLLVSLRRWWPDALLYGLLLAVGVVIIVRGWW